MFSDSNLFYSDSSDKGYNLGANIKNIYKKIISYAEESRDKHLGFREGNYPYKNHLANKDGKANIQDKLKTIAIFAMIIDHVGFYFFPKIDVFRVIGRIAMPMFCFFAGYNFKGKRKSLLLKYGFLLSIIAFIATGSIPTLNILFTIYLGQLYIQKIYTETHDFISNMFQIFALVIFTPATFLLFDYGSMAIAIMALGFMYKTTTQNQKIYVFLVTSFMVLYSQVLFWFDLHNFILLILMGVMLYYLLANSGKYELEVKSDWIYSISRNSMFIYFVNIGILHIFFILPMIIK